MIIDFKTLPLVKVTLERPVIGTVEAFEEWQGDYGPNYSIALVTSDGLVKITERKEPIDRQLARKSMATTIEQMCAVGANLKFHRVPGPGPGKTYLNIDFADEAAASAAKSLAPAMPPAAETPRAEWPARVDVALGQYLAALDGVKKVILSAYYDLEIPMDAQALNAIVATVMIRAERG